MSDEYQEALSHGSKVVEVPLMTRPLGPDSENYGRSALAENAAIEAA